MSDDSNPESTRHEIDLMRHRRTQLYTEEEYYAAIAKLNAIRDFINGQTKHNCGLIRTLKEMLNEN